jgi:hypothetical protein
MVDPDYRRHGIANQMFHYGLKREIVTLGNNPSPQANSVMLKLGFKPVPSGRIMLFPIDARHISKWFFPKKPYFVSSLTNKIIQPYFTYKQRQDRIPYLQVLHCEKFMEWRATGIEHYSPRIGAAKMKDGSYCVHSNFDLYYNIFEWYCKSFEALKDMISLIIELAIKNKSQTLQIMANDENEESSLKKLGFLRTRNMENIIYYSKNNSLNKADKFYFTLYDTDLNL